MNNITELVFIIDKSGSMAGLESDTIGGFNATIKKHKKDKESKAYVTTILFNTNFDMIHDRVELSNIKQMKESDYEVGGSTALLDAVGETIEHIKKIHKYVRQEDVPGKTLFVIITDGMENASHKYDHYQIKSMISAMREEKKWEFIFLGANIEAEEVAESYGILKERSINYHSDKRGTKAAWESIGMAVDCCMASEEKYCCDRLSKSDWKKAIREDRKKRHLSKYDIDDEDAA